MIDLLADLDPSIIENMKMVWKTDPNRFQNIFISELACIPIPEGPIMYEGPDVTATYADDIDLMKVMMFGPRNPDMEYLVGIFLKYHPCFLE